MLHFGSLPCSLQFHQNLTSVNQRTLGHNELKSIMASASIMASEALAHTGSG